MQWNNFILVLYRKISKFFIHKAKNKNFQIFTILYMKISKYEVLHKLSIEICFVTSQQCVLACYFQDLLYDITNWHYYFMNHRNHGRTKIGELYTTNKSKFSLFILKNWFSCQLSLSFILQYIEACQLPTWKITWVHDSSWR